MVPEEDCPSFLLLIGSVREPRQDDVHVKYRTKVRRNEGQDELGIGRREGQEGFPDTVSQNLAYFKGEFEGRVKAYFEKKGKFPLK